MNRRQQMRRHTSDEAAIERHVREMLHEDRDGGDGTPPARSPRPDGGTAERQSGERTNPAPPHAPSGDSEPEGAEDRS